MVVQSLRSTSSQRGQSSARDCVRASCGYHGRGTRRSAARADAQAVDRQPVVQNRYDSFLADDMLGKIISWMLVGDMRFPSESLEAWRYRLNQVVGSRSRRPLPP
ncbi:hypothetical protein V6N13_088987 [Hibiscus sabdariffa]